jgi:hypothetical protein
MTFVKVTTVYLGEDGYPENDETRFCCLDCMAPHNGVTVFHHPADGSEKNRSNCDDCGAS